MRIRDWSSDVCSSDLKGNVDVRSRASGRRYCTRVVGTNWSPKKEPSLASRKCCRTGSTIEMPWLSKGTENKLRNWIQFTAAYTTTGAAAAAASAGIRRRPEIGRAHV